MASTFVRHGLDISGQAVLEIFAALPELFLARPGIFGPAVKLILSRVVDDGSLIMDDTYYMRDDYSIII